MPDFDANEDHTRLPDAGPGDRIEPVNARPPSLEGKRANRAGGARRATSRTRWATRGSDRQW